MRRSALPVVIVACVIVAAVLAWLAVGRMFRAAAEDAAGPPASEVRPVGEFSKLDVSGLVNLTIIQANRREVVVEAARGQASRVRSEVSGNTLRITVRPPRGKRIRDAADPDLRVVVRTPSIEAIELSGAVKLAAPALAVPALAIDASGAASIRIDALQVDSLRFVGSGAVEAELAGRATEQSISLSGAGRVRSPRLASASARVDVSSRSRSMRPAPSPMLMPARSLAKGLQCVSERIPSPRKPCSVILQRLSMPPTIAASIKPRSMRRMADAWTLPLELHAVDTT